MPNWQGIDLWWCLLCVSLTEPQHAQIFGQALFAKIRSLSSLFPVPEFPHFRAHFFWILFMFYISYCFLYTHYIESNSTLKRKTDWITVSRPSRWKPFRPLHFSATPVQMFCIYFEAYSVNITILVFPTDNVLVPVQLNHVFSRWQNFLKKVLLWQTWPADSTNSSLWNSTGNKLD